MQVIGKLFGSSTAYQNLKIETYRQEFKRGIHTLVDVRSAGEFQLGHLPKAINIPLNQLQRRLDDLPTGKPIIVVCASGNRSRTGAKVIARSGREDVYNLQGGTNAWVQSGYPIE